jgi:hypothetical protein
MYVHLHHFSKIKGQKTSQNSRNQGFSYYIGLMIEGSGSIPWYFWIQEAQKHLDPTDLDPQQRFWGSREFSLFYHENLTEFSLFFT